jgi:hypothetical protein
MMEKKELINIIDQILGAFKKNKIDALFVESRQAALQSILERIPLGATVGAGDSVTLEEIGIFKELKRGKFTLYWPFDEEVPKEEQRNIAKKALLADVFLSGANAITVDGKIVNADATGNRVVGMIFGPKKAIIAVGTNKIVKNLDEALERIRNVAAPLNARRIREKRGWELLPCVKIGRCVNCDAENRICNITTIIEKKPRAIDITVIIVGENLGL